MSVKTQQIPTTQIKPNDQNPRTIKDVSFRKLVESIKQFPEMANVRPIILNKENTILGGNMRFRAMVEAGWQTVPAIYVDWSEEKQREFIIKDNVSGGEWDWDLLANEWDAEKLLEWGLEIPPEYTLHPDQLADSFQLPDGEKSPFEQITFTLATQQADSVRTAIQQAKNLNMETYDNENGNGNALYWICKQWLAQKT